MLPEQNSNLISLETTALERLGSIAERRMRLYLGRAFAEPEQIRLIERRYNHLARIVNLFEVEQEGVA